jgi:hypothetical protein
VQCAGDGVAPGRETGVASITKQVGCVYLWSVRQSPSDRDIDACSHGGRRKRGHLFVGWIIDVRTIALKEEGQKRCHARTRMIGPITKSVCAVKERAKKIVEKGNYTRHSFAIYTCT